MAGAAGSARVSAQLGGEGVAFAGDLLTCHVTVEGVGAALTLGRGLAQVVGHAVFDTSVRVLRRARRVLTAVLR